MAAYKSKVNSKENISKQFNPDLFRSYYIGRKLLIKNISEKIGLLNGKMLDFGCGSKPYFPLFNVEEYIGVDYEGQGHSHENEQIDFFYDGITLPFENETFDSVFSSEVFEHVFNLETILKEINRVMKPGAIILFTCPFIIAEHEIPNDFGRYTSFGLQDLLKRNGFEIVYYKKLGTTIESAMQILLSYFDSYVISKLNFFKPVKIIVQPIFFLSFNLFTKLINFILPKRQDAFLNHIVVCKKNISIS